jgi:hypothetical protein
MSLCPIEQLAHSHGWSRIKGLRENSPFSLNPFDGENIAPQG